MRLRHILLAVLAASSPAMTQAQDLDLFYTEPVGGVYTQDWFGRIIGADRIDGVLVFVRGDGKSGNFYGVLSVNCEDAERSKWVSTGGVIAETYVPATAINIIRAEACSSP